MKDQVSPYQPPDLIAIYNRRRIVATAYKGALFLWSAMVLFTLIAMVVTGSVFFGILGYAVTVPFLVVCYKLRRQLAHVDDITVYCHFYGCDIP